MVNSCQGGVGEYRSEEEEGGKGILWWLFGKLEN